MKQKLKNNIFKKYINIYAVLVVAFWAVVVFCLNYAQPLLYDDYLYNDSKNIYEVLKNNYLDYINFNSRYISQFFTRMFLLVGKPVFNIVNTIIILSINYIITKICIINDNHDEFKNIVLFSISCFIFLTLSPDKTTPFWLNGSCNYIFPLFFILLTNYIFIRLLYNANSINSKYVIFLLSILFLFSGLSNESLAPAAILLNMFFLYMCVKDNKKNINIYYAFIALSVIGFLLIIFAPGTISRLKHFNFASETVFMMLIRKLFSLSVRYYEQFGLLTFIYLFMIVYLIVSKKEEIENFKIKLSIIFMSFAIISNYILVLSPVAPERAKFIVYVYIIIAIMLLLNVMMKNMYIYNAVIPIYLAAHILIVPFCIVCTNSILHKKIQDNNIEYINNEISRGQDEIFITSSFNTIIDDKQYNIPQPIKSLTRECYELDRVYNDFYNVNVIYDESKVKP